MLIKDSTTEIGREEGKRGKKGKSGRDEEKRGKLNQKESAVKVIRTFPHSLDKNYLDSALLRETCGYVS